MSPVAAGCIGFVLGTIFTLVLVTLTANPANGPGLKVRIYVRLSWILLVGGFIGWASTHTAIVITKPPELSSWVGHLLIAISWLAIVVAAYGNIVTADVRREQEDE